LASLGHFCRRRGDETHFKFGFRIFSQSLLTLSPTISGFGATSPPPPEISPLQFRQPPRDLLGVGAAVEGADAETALPFEPEFLSRLPRQCLFPFQQRGMRIVKSAVEGMRREIV